YQKLVLLIAKRSADTIQLTGALEVSVSTLGGDLPNNTYESDSSNAMSLIRTISLLRSISSTLATSDLMSNWVSMALALSSYLMKMSLRRMFSVARSGRRDVAATSGSVMPKSSAETLSASVIGAHCLP